MPLSGVPQPRHDSGRQGTTFSHSLEGISERSNLSCPGWPPRLRFDFGFGGGSGFAWGCSDDGGLDQFFGVLFSRASSSAIFTSNVRMIACDSGGCCAGNSSVISSDIQNVVADSFYQGQVTFTCFSKQPVNAYSPTQKRLKVSFLLPHQLRQTNAAQIHVNSPTDSSCETNHRPGTRQEIRSPEAGCRDADPLGNLYHFRMSSDGQSETASDPRHRSE